MRANIEATQGAVFAEKAAMLLAPQMGRTKVQALVAEDTTRESRLGRA